MTYATSLLGDKALRRELQTAARRNNDNPLHRRQLNLLYSEYGYPKKILLPSLDQIDLTEVDHVEWFSPNAWNRISIEGVDEVDSAFTAMLPMLLWGSLVQASGGNARRLHNAASMLGQRLRRWPSIEATLGERLVFSGSCESSQCSLTLLHTVQYSTIPGRHWGIRRMVGYWQNVSPGYPSLLMLRMSPPFTPEPLSHGEVSKHTHARTVSIAPHSPERTPLPNGDTRVVKIANIIYAWMIEIMYLWNENA